MLMLGMILFQSAMTHLYNVARQNRGCLEMLEPTKGRSGNGRMARKTAGRAPAKRNSAGREMAGTNIYKRYEYTGYKYKNTNIQIYKYKYTNTGR